MEPEIKQALIRFREVLKYLECECDSYHGFTCTLHSDVKLANKALEIINGSSSVLEHTWSPG